MKSLIIKWIAVLAFVGWTGTANASLLTYSIDGVGSGELNGAAFNGAAFRIDLVGDPANFSSASFDVHEVDPLISAIVSITGLPAATLNFATRLGINVETVYFSRSVAIGGLDLMDFSIGTAVDLTAPFGPLPNTGAVFALNQFQNVATSAGLLSFDAVRSVIITGNGATSVPVPATLALLGFALAGLGWSRRTSV